MTKKGRSTHRRRVIFSVFSIVSLVGLAGCRTMGYYTQAVRGQCQMLAREKLCVKLLADTNTPASLRSNLELAANVCAFADSNLGLKVDGNYTRYADLGRPYVVWNIYAAPEFSLAARTWWYPFVGSLDYQGYFTQRGAERYAAVLREEGYDVHVEGVEAYSTLGWFKDPLLNTFIHHGEATLAEILFHELAHQRVFASGDTDFNEAFATAVGQEGTRRWLRAHSQTDALQRYERALERNAQFVRLVQETRAKLGTLYGDRRGPDGELIATMAPPLSAGTLREQKKRVLDELQRDFTQLTNAWGGGRGYHAWFATGVNNAQLNSVATYYDLVPAFEQLLEAHGGDLEGFYAAAKHLARLPKTERHQRLTMPLN